MKSEVERIESNTFRAKSPLFCLSKELKVLLEDASRRSETGSSRICLHANTNEKTQNMIIYIQPNNEFYLHKHPTGKMETYTVIEGVLFIEIYPEGIEKESVILKLTSENSPYYHTGGIAHRPYTLGKHCLYQEVYHGTFKRDVDVIRVAR